MWRASYGVNGKMPVCPFPRARRICPTKASFSWALGDPNLGAFFHGGLDLKESLCRSTLSRWVVVYMRAREPQRAASGHKLFFFCGGPVLVEAGLWARTSGARRRTGGPPRAGRARPLAASNGEAGWRRQSGQAAVDDLQEPAAKAFT